MSVSQDIAEAGKAAARFLSKVSWQGVACGIAGGLCVGAIVLSTSQSAGAKLNADLASAKQSLADAQNTDRQLSGTVSQLQSQLTDASEIATDEQRLIDSQESELADLANTITSGGGDLESVSRQIASEFDSLFAVYNPSPNTGKGS